MIDFKSNEIFIKIIFFYGIMGIPLFHIFYKPKYLLLNKPYILILKLLIFIALLSLIFYLYKLISFELFLFTLFPFYQVILYRCSFLNFLHKMKRIPRDVVFNFKTGLFIDRAFAMFYLILAIMVPITILLCLK